MIEIVPEEDIKSSIVEHHTKYKEIHGEDKSVFITKSEHSQLHRRLRKEGKCKISPEVLHKISHRAQGRTEKRKRYYKRYRKYHESDEYLEIEKYRDEKGQEDINVWDEIYDSNIKRQEILEKLKK